MQKGQHWLLQALQPPITHTPFSPGSPGTIQPTLPCEETCGWLPFSRCSMGPNLLILNNLSRAVLRAELINFCIFHNHPHKPSSWGTLLLLISIKPLSVLATEQRSPYKGWDEFRKSLPFSHGLLLGVCAFGAIPTASHRGGHNERLWKFFTSC